MLLKHMDKWMRRALTFSVVMLPLCITSCAQAPHSPAQRAPVTAQTNLSDIFAKPLQYGGTVSGQTYVLSQPVKDFFKLCCESAEEAVRLLEQEGFTVTDSRASCKLPQYKEGQEQARKTIAPSCETQKLAALPLYATEQYDTIYVGRKTPLHNYRLYAHEEYRIILYLKNEHIAEISAISGMQSL